MEFPFAIDWCWIEVDDDDVTSHQICARHCLLFYGPIDPKHPKPGSERATCVRVVKLFPFRRMAQWHWGMAFGGPSTNANNEVPLILYFGSKIIFHYVRFLTQRIGQISLLLRNHAVAFGLFADPQFG